MMVPRAAALVVSSWLLAACAGLGGADAESAAGGGAGGSEEDIKARLQAIPGLSVTEQPSKHAGYRRFLLTFQQPADHHDPSGLRFEQRMVLEHRAASAPFILATTGYNIYPEDQALSEPAELLSANELLIEERFFTPSRPAPASFSLLTIAQAAADHHLIAAAMKPLYPGRWISTGVSKGGMTSIYHRRFYPSDVDATVAYVAPESVGIADQRYLAFLAQVGDAPCRDALKGFQAEALARRPAMMAALHKKAVSNGETYDFLGRDRAFEYGVIELPFTFWQYYGKALCGDIPTAASADAEVWSFLDKINSPSFWRDASMLTYEPYFYQAATELGYPAYADDYLAPSLMFPGTDVPSTFVAPGPGKEMVFHPEAMQDIAAWVGTQGQSLLFIYGAADPYSAAAFDLGGAQDSYRLFVPGGNHGAEIVDLADPDRQTAEGALAAWAGVATRRSIPDESRAMRARVRRRAR
jgi:hypothetical protein